MKKRKTTGLALLEVLIACGLLSTIVAATYNLLMVSTNAASVNGVEADLQGRCNDIVAQIAKDLKDGASSVDTPLNAVVVGSELSTSVSTHGTVNATGAGPGCSLQKSCGYNAGAITWGDGANAGQTIYYELKAGPAVTALMTLSSADDAAIENQCFGPSITWNAGDQIFGGYLIVKSTTLAAGGENDLVLTQNAAVLKDSSGNIKAYGLYFTKQNAAGTASTTGTRMRVDVTLGRSIFIEKGNVSPFDNAQFVSHATTVEFMN